MGSKALLTVFQLHNTTGRLYPRSNYTDEEKKKNLLQNENQNWAIFMMIGLTPGSYWSILFLATLSLFALQVRCYNTIPQ